MDKPLTIIESIERAKSLADSLSDEDKEAVENLIIIARRFYESIK